MNFKIYKKMKAIEYQKKINTWVEAMKKGAYGNSKEIVDTYNAIFQGIKPKQNYTTCGSCLRRCINTMNTQLQAELQLVEEQKAKGQEKKNEEQIKETPITDLTEEIKKTIKKTKKNNEL